MGIESGKMGNEYPNINLVIQMLEKPRSIYIVTLHPSPLQIFIILTYSIPMFSRQTSRPQAYMQLIKNTFTQKSNKKIWILPGPHSHWWRCCFISNLSEWCRDHVCPNTLGPPESSWTTSSTLWATRICASFHKPQIAGSVMKFKVGFSSSHHPHIVQFKMFSFFSDQSKCTLA